jgi:serine/threonine protein kinase
LVTQPAGQPAVFYLSGLPVGPQREAAVLSLLSDVLQALQFAHGKRVLHNDVRPANIIVDSNEDAYLVDFGLSSRATQRVQPLGQAMFMADAALTALDRKATWAPSVFSDLQSVAYTAAALLNKPVCGFPPWDGLHLEGRDTVQARAEWYRHNRAHLPAVLTHFWDVAHEASASRPRTASSLYASLIA